MGMNLVRTGTSAVTGVASGVLSGPQISPLNLGGTAISWGLIAEAAALVGGAGMQLFMPFTASNLADGMVDGGAALLSSRAALWAMKRQGQSAAFRQSGTRGSMATQVSPGMISQGARAQVGVTGGTKKLKIS
jgi:hypothetical protein